MKDTAFGTPPPSSSSSSSTSSSPPSSSSSSSHQPHHHHKTPPTVPPSPPTNEFERRVDRVSQTLGAEGRIVDTRRPQSAFRAFNEIMTQNARLNSMLWGGAVGVGILAYAVGRWLHRNDPPPPTTGSEAR